MKNKYCIECMHYRKKMYIGDSVFGDYCFHPDNRVMVKNYIKESRGFDKEPAQRNKNNNCAWHEIEVIPVKRSWFKRLFKWIK